MTYKEKHMKATKVIADQAEEIERLRDNCQRAMYMIDSKMKEIQKLREEISGYIELIGANNAIVAAVLHAVGAEKDKPIKVDRAVLGAAVKGQYLGISEVKEEDPSVFWLHYEEFAPEGEE